MDRSQKFQSPNNHWDKSSLSGNSGTPNYCSNKKEEAIANKRTPERFHLHATPRPPLHRKIPGAKNPEDRLILCKGCGSLSADISAKCCQGGKESKFTLSPSISIGPAASSKEPHTTVEASKIRIPVYNHSPSHSSKSKEPTKDVQHNVKVRRDPVVLLLSSDDEAPEVSVAPRLKNAAQRERAKASAVTERSKEIHQEIHPEIHPEIHQEIHHWSPAKDEMRNDIRQLTEVEIDNIYEPLLCIKCKKVHIGSYRTYPTERILFLQSGIRFSVAHPSSQESVTIALPTKHLLKIFWYSGPDASFLVFYVKEKLAQHIRHLLDLHTHSEIYFDPCSDLDSEKKLMLFLDELNEDILNQLKNLFYNIRVTDFLQKIDDIKPFLPSINNQESSFDNETSGRMSPTDPNIIFHFSPRGSKGAITLTIDDFLCLEEGEFLNDVIIDFYIRYLILKRFERSVAARTHVFSTFFYNSLTAFSKSKESLSPAQRRHNRVQNWTKDVDIFDKDFIIIPINKKLHWFLAIICFPHLLAPIGFRDKVHRQWRPLRKRKKARTYDEVETVDESERDEASSEDSSASSDDDYEVDEPIRQPCIIIFDSLRRPTPRTKVVATLRKYLQMEFFRRKGVPRTFNKLTMRGIYPEVPQQTNHYDCGVYTLQYVESFFTRPLSDYSQALSLQNWFLEEEVTTKREKIMQLFKDLRKDQFPNTYFNFPLLTTRAEIDQYQLDNSSQSPSSVEAACPADESSGKGPIGPGLSWAESFKNSFSVLKRHLSTDMDADMPSDKPKRARVAGEKIFL